MQYTQNLEIQHIKDFLNQIEPDKFYPISVIKKRVQNSSFIENLIDQKILVQGNKGEFAYDSRCWLPFSTHKGYPNYWDEDPIPLFSFYKKPAMNKYPEKEITIVQVYQAIKSLFRKETDQLRTITSPGQARRFKELNFNYVTFSGSFTERVSGKLKKHSGYICLDFDKVPEPDRIKEKLITDSVLPTILLFVSPSGNGLKCVTQIDISQGSHEQYFDAIRSYIIKTHGIEADRSGRDVTRACFLCHDPNVYLNPSLL